MANITYLIGAGASAKALPVVSNWTNRLKEFQKYLSNLDGFDLVNGTEKLDINLSKIQQSIAQLIDKLDGHATVDTYAKKLFLRNQEQDHKELINLKFLLGLFFVYEQTALKSFWNQFQFAPQAPGSRADDVRGILNTNWEGQRNQKDKRYDVFLATLLNENSVSLDSRINIISWNYDYQFELAYEEFSQGKKLKTFPKSSKNDLPDDNIQPQIIKLNGTAGLFYKQGTNGNVFSLALKNNEINIDENTSGLPSLDAMLCLYSNFLENKLIDINPFLNFAWESNQISQQSLKFAERIMSQTEVLVVIGYSFPNFNRAIDSKILLNAKKLKRTYIQAPEASAQDLVQRYKWLMKETIDAVPYTDVEQFFIPYELDKTYNHNTGVRRVN